MGYALLDQPNPSGPNYYTTRNRPLLAIVVHITAGLQDLDATDDQSAEGVVRYAQSTTRDVSWHVSTDSDSTIELLPPGYTAWHASAYNSGTYGHEISKLHTDWRTVPALWVDRTLHQAARHAAKIVREFGVPIRKATRAELDVQYAHGWDGDPVGFISHWELDPDRRDDPGRLPGTQLDTFPWARYLDLVRTYAAGGPVLTDDQANELGSVYAAIYKRNDGSFEFLDPGDQSIIGRLVELQQGVRALVGRPVNAALSDQQMAELKAEIRAAESDADADAVITRLWQRLTPTTG